MKDFSRNGLIGRAIGLWQEIRDLRIPLHAANTGFFLILSVFPALVLLLSIIRYTPLDVHSLLRFLEGIIPEALLPEMELLIVNTYENTTGAVVSLSAITALWSASRGVYGLITGLNAVYRVPEQRRFLQLRLLSVLYTFAFLLVLLLTLVLHVFGTGILELMTGSSIPFFRFLSGVWICGSSCWYSCKPRCFPLCLWLCQTAKTLWVTACPVLFWPPSAGWYFPIFSPCMWRIFPPIPGSTALCMPWR